MRTMRTILAPVFFLFFLPALLPAQTSAERESLAGMDREARKLGTLIAGEFRHREDRPRLRPGLFTAGDKEPLMGTYWKEQLGAVLSDAVLRGEQREKFVLMEPESSGNGGEDDEADYELSGELVEIGRILRIYTRLVLLPYRVVERSWTTDLPITELVSEMLEPPSRNFSRRVRRDSLEEDSRDAPVEVLADGPWIGRTLHRGDEDWFRITAPEMGLLILETRGDTDTFLELYDPSGSKLAENDDGGEDANARLEYPAEGGTSYIAKVRPYDNDAGGSYGFRAFMTSLPEDPFEPNNTRERAAPIRIGEAAEAYFYSGDVDWYAVEVPAGTPLRVYTEGRLDTLITLYDTGGGELESDDDSGSGSNALLSISAPAGTLYIKVTEYGEGRGSYTLHVKTETN